MSEIKSLIAHECANYQGNGPFGIKNFCWMKEKSNGGVCVYFNQENPRCGYFETGVLPLDQDLHETYLTEHMKPEAENGEGREGAKDRATHPGSGSVQSPKGKSADTPGVSVERIALDKARRPRFLSRT